MELYALLQEPDDPAGRNAEGRRYPKTLAVEVINDVEGSDAPAIRQGVAHEVHRPLLVLLHRDLNGVGRVVLDPAAQPLGQGEPALLVYPADLALPVLGVPLSNKGDDLVPAFAAGPQNAGDGLPQGLVLLGHPFLVVRAGTGAA